MRHRYKFTDPELLRLALRHSSMGGVNNSQLAWLGNDLLALLVASQGLLEMPSASRKGELHVLAHPTWYPTHCLALQYLCRVVVTTN